MSFVLDPDHALPLYAQLAAGVRDAIAAGLYREGDPLPSIRAFAVEHQVNYHTVAKAYRQLSEDGVLTRKRGDSWRVGPRTRAPAGRDLVRGELAGLVARARRFGLRRSDLHALIDEVWAADAETA